MYIYTFIYIYVCIRIYLSVHISIYTNKHKYANLSLFVSVHVFIYSHIQGDLSMLRARLKQSQQRMLRAHEISAKWTPKKLRPKTGNPAIETH